MKFNINGFLSDWKVRILQDAAGSASSSNSTNGSGGDWVAAFKRDLNDLECTHTNRDGGNRFSILFESGGRYVERGLDTRYVRVGKWTISGAGRLCLEVGGRTRCNQFTRSTAETYLKEAKGGSGCRVSW